MFGTQDCRNNNNPAEVIGKDMKCVCLRGYHVVMRSSFLILIAFVSISVETTDKIGGSHDGRD